MKLLDIPVGLLINFHEVKLTAGISRLVLSGAGLDGTEDRKGSKDRF